ncbi:MAG TPA: SpoIVB peptidase [Firmicutes bacterium]|nr:SpoIVB peptidase [Bacillota bacterium]
MQRNALHPVKSWAVITTAVIFSFFGILLAISAPSFLRFPSHLRLFPGQEYSLHTGLLLTVAEAGLPKTSPSRSILAKNGRQVTLQGTEIGAYHLALKIFGLIPIKTALINVVPEIAVYPGGQAVGVLLSAQGLMVTDTVALLAADGTTRSPAAEAGIMAGDIIIKLAGMEPGHFTSMEEIIATYGRQQRPVPIEVRRGAASHEFYVTPLLAKDPNGPGYRYMLGLYLRDPVAGVGTLTFWEPESRRFGALGHMIANDDRQPLVITNGVIVPAVIQGIQPAVKGHPGEKLGLFADGSPELGKIDKNTEYGIFGRLEHLPAETEYSRLIPVALAHEVVTGQAEILTVIKDEQVERFTIEILEVNRHKDSKGLVVKVTDPVLLEKTKGIVQGMSGSPIIQGGKLVGALTHVFIHSPEKGFGVLAEWMIYEAGIAEAVSLAEAA